jgi:hypothetical protein
LFAWTLKGAGAQRSALKRDEQMQLYQMEMQKQEKQHTAKLRPLHKEQENQHLRQRHEQEVHGNSRDLSSSVTLIKRELWKIAERNRELRKAIIWQEWRHKAKMARMQVEAERDG